MKITDADYEDHISKLESGFKATFGEDLAPYLVTQMCFDLLAAKKIEYVKSYLRTWSGMELFNLADRMLKRETSMPPGLRGVITGHGPAAPGLIGMVKGTLGGNVSPEFLDQSKGLANNGDLEKAVKMAADLNRSLQASVAQGPKEKKTKAGGGTVSSIEQARAKKAVEDISKTPPKK